MNQVNTDIVLKAIAALISGGNTAFAGAVAGLFTGFTGGATGLTRQTTLDQLIEADFDGYARSSAVAWGTVQTLPDGGWGYVGDRKQFIAGANAALPGEVVIGGFLVNGANNTSLMAAGVFDNPISIINPGDAVNWNPSLTVVFDTDYSKLNGPAS